MIYIYYFLAAVLIYLCYRSFLGGLEYLRFYRAELAKPPSDFTPFATIIAPCRGFDEGMRDNLEALLMQTYPEYEVIFVVDDPADAAVTVIRDLIDNSGPAVPAKIVIAGKAAGSSQKVENLREAVRHAAERTEVFAFVDSDVRPSQGWLRSLVAPLKDGKIGSATGYRWFISPSPTFASELRSSWNASVASALGPDTGSNFCWGGSMAIRRDIFERIGMREKWSGTLSDDFAVTRALNDAQLPIVFVPQALTASVENCSFREMIEFTTRQMKITRVYQTKLWVLSFIGSGLFNFVMIAAFLVIVLNRTDTFAVSFSMVTIVLVTLFSVAKAWLRLRAVRLILTQYSTELRRQLLSQNTLWLLSPAVFFYNACAALASRQMVWRGIRYELKSPSETVIMSD